LPCRAEPSGTRRGRCFIKAALAVNQLRSGQFRREQWARHRSSQGQKLKLKGGLSNSAHGLLLDAPHVLAVSHAFVRHPRRARDHADPSAFPAAVSAAIATALAASITAAVAIAATAACTGSAGATTGSTAAVIAASTAATAVAMAAVAAPA